MKITAVLATFLAGVAMAAPAPVQEPGEVCLMILVYKGMDCPAGTVSVYFKSTALYKS